MQEKLAALRRRLNEIADIRSALSLMHWDQEVYMPPKGGEARAQQLATLTALEHRLFTDAELGRLLHELKEGAEPLAGDDAALVDETLYDYERAAKLPESFVHEMAEAQSRAFQVWVTARAESDFSQFEKPLEGLVALLKQKADLLGYEESPYDALLEDHERGMTAKAVSALFAELGREQSDLVGRIVDSGVVPDTGWLDQGWPEPQQWDMSLRILRDMGFDLEAGRQDKSPHPFTINFDMRDVRITTRIDTGAPFSGLMGSIHEGGHALYEQGFLEKDRRTTLAAAPSLGIHESQSRMWENMVGRSRAFWQHYFPVLREFFPGQLAGVEAEQVYGAVNRVAPSLIRVEADECTYNLHVILRFELELAVMEGKMKVGEIPEAWNAKMKEWLGVDVPDDAQGCLQDVHWSHGAFGYFPTYTLGNLFAADLFEQILADIPDLWAQIGEGAFAPLLGWLREHVHRWGRRKLAVDIVRDATGREPGSEAYLRYLKAKYGELYGV